MRDAQAVCPGDTRALGGGVVQSGSASGLWVLTSGPLDESGITAQTNDGDIPKMWYAAVKNGTGGPVNFKVFAVCSDTSSATIEATSIGNSGHEAFAICPSGKRALGGGIVQSGPPGNASMQASGPLDSSGTTLETNDGDTADRWYAAVGLYHRTEERRVFAICTSGPPATIEQTTFTVAGNGVGSPDKFAKCPGSKRALGGGVVQSGTPDLLRVRASGPLDATGVTATTDDGDKATQWYASVLNSATTTRTFRVFAICE